MRIHYLQHVAHEALGSTAEWAASEGHTVTGTRLYAGESLPETIDFDWLFVMGGPMNIYEHDEYPWLAQEKAFIRRAVDAGKTVIGICLGAQLISDVLGGPVVSNGQQEIGWFSVYPSASLEPPLDRVLPEAEVPVFHWHGDRFTVPEGAVPFAHSEACPSQGFVFDGRVFGFQFHPEVTREVAAAFIEADSPLPEGRFVQAAEAMLGDGAPFEVQQRRWFAFLSGLAGR